MSHDGSITEYRLISEADPAWATSWSIPSVYLSAVTLGICVTPRHPSALRQELEKDDVDEDDAKTELRSLIGFITALAADQGITRPTVAVAYLFPTHPGHGPRRNPPRNPERVSASVWHRLQAWGTDQEWHRGLFAFYAAWNESGATDLLRELLDPRPPAWYLSERQPPTEKEILFQRLHEPPTPHAEELVNRLREATDEDPDALLSALQQWHDRRLELAAKGNRE